MPFAEKDCIVLTEPALLELAGPSVRGAALSACDVFAHIALYQPPLIRIRIHRIVSRQGGEEPFYPSPRGRIVTCSEAQLAVPSAEQKARIDAADAKAKRAAEFFGLRKYDKVVVEDPRILAAFFDHADDVKEADLVLAVVTGTLERDSDGTIDLRLRSVTSPRREARRTLVIRETTDRFGIVRPVRFHARAEHVRRATADDVLKSCTAEPTASDRMAICYPAYFIARVADYDWVRVKSFLKPGKDGSPAKLTHNFGGMDALLEYRSWLCETILNSVKELAWLKARAARAEPILSGAWNPLFNPADLQEVDQAFIDGTEPIGWAAPGSTEATSDIDVNMFGSGTEWAVRAANFLYRSLHADHEAGTVFDVNLYAQDFLPPFREQFKLRSSDQGAELLEPDYVHRFTEPELQEVDAASQLQSALLHLRRYASSAEWTEFRTLMAARFRDGDPRREQFDLASARVSSGHQRNLVALARLMRDLLRDRNVPGEDGRPVRLALDYNENDFSSVEAFVRNHLVPEDVRLRAENQLYENCLLSPTGVSVLRNVFNLEKHRFDRAKASAPQSLTAFDRAAVDAAYADLRAQVCQALYFANEAYSTEGSLVQVVGGKQMLSRGTTMDRSRQARSHNIRYTADQLIHTMTEQVGDFFKQSTRRYNAEPRGTESERAAAYAAALSDSAKYLHRYFNAMKYLYARFAATRADEVYLVVKEGTHSEDEYSQVLEAMLEVSFTAYYPGSLYPPGLAEEKKAESFESLRRACGIGLTMLRKFNFKEASAGQKNELAKKLSLPADGELMTKGDAAAIARHVVRQNFQSLDGAAFANVADLPGFKTALLTMQAAVFDDFFAFKQRPRPRPQPPA